MDWSEMLVLESARNQIKSFLLCTILVTGVISAENNNKMEHNYGPISLHNRLPLRTEEEEKAFKALSKYDSYEKLQIKNLYPSYKGRSKRELKHDLYINNYKGNSTKTIQEENQWKGDNKLSDTMQCWPYYVFKKKVHLREICRIGLARNEKKMSGEIPSKSKRGGRGVIKIRDLEPRRFSKFLNLFTIVNFPNELCVDGDDSFGTCYHHTECERLGGIEKGTCANGYGVCCYIQHTCGQRTNANGTYFVAGNFLNTSENGIFGCSLIIDKADFSVKQIRLDFIHLKIAGPLDGNCQIDRFVVSGQNKNNIIPEICGVNSGQHMYLEVDMTDGPIMVAILSSGAKGVPQNFVMRVLQLRDGNSLMAPSSCLQYHQGDSGIISSFNYQTGVSDINYGYMNGLNYAVCIKKEIAFCSITYSNLINKIEMPFELKNVDEEGLLTVNPGEAGAESYNCPDDYIVLNKIKLCGYRLNDASENPDFRSNHLIRDADNGPFVISVRTNSNVTGRGFSLQYNQVLC